MKLAIGGTCLFVPHLWESPCLGGAYKSNLNFFENNLKCFWSHFGIVNSLFPRIAIMGDKKFPCRICMHGKLTTTGYAPWCLRRVVTHFFLENLFPRHVERSRHYLDFVAYVFKSIWLEYHVPSWISTKDTVKLDYLSPRPQTVKIEQGKAV